MPPCSRPHLRSRSRSLGGLLAAVAALAAAGTGCRRGSPRLEAIPAPEEVPACDGFRLQLLSEVPPDRWEGDADRVDARFPPLRDDQRHSFTIRPPARFRIRGVLPPEARLVSFGAYRPPSRPSPLPVLLRLSADRGSRTTLLGTWSGDGASGEAGWSDVAFRVPEGRPGDPPADLVVEVQGPNGTELRWSRPTVCLPAATPAPRVVPEPVARIDLLTTRRDPACPDGSPPLGVEGRVAPRDPVQLEPHVPVRFAFDARPDDELRLKAHPPVLDRPAGRPAPLSLRWLPAEGTTGGTEGRSEPETVDVGVDPWRKALGLAPATVVLPVPPGAPERRILEVEATGDDPVLLTRLEVGRPAEPGRAVPDRAAPDVLLLLVDTFRADRTSPYGSERDTTPRLAEAARRGIVFETAVAASPWTVPSLISIHTGLDAARHGAVAFGRNPPPAAAMLAERFLAAGFRTAAFVANPLVRSETGFGRGFETFRDMFFATAEELGDAVLQWFGEPTDRPRFAWVHYMDPHLPYAAPEPWYGRYDPEPRGLLDHSMLDREHDPLAEWLFHAFVSGAFVETDPAVPEDRIVPDVPRNTLRLGGRILPRLRDLYDAELAYWDHEFGRLLDRLQRPGGRDLVVLVVGDHGEGFGEHRQLGHQFDLHDEQIRVPLVLIDSAETAPRRVSGIASLIDVAVLLSERAGLPVPPDAAGWPLRRIDSAEGRTRAAFSFTAYSAIPSTDGPLPRLVAAYSMRSTAEKRIRVPFLGTEIVYDLAGDPAERAPLAAPGPAPAAFEDFAERLRRIDLLQLGGTVGREADEEALRALGYLQ